MPNKSFRDIKKLVREAALCFAPSRKLLAIKDSRTHQKRVKCYRDDGPKIAYRACEALNNAGIDVWLYAGSLLGAVRDGDFIPWDCDLDLCIIADELFDWNRLETAMSKGGFRRVREFTCDGVITEQAYTFYKTGGFNFDIFSMRPLDEERAHLFAYGRRDGIHYKEDDEVSVLCLDTFIPKGRRIVNIRGWDLPVPENAEELLERNYGPGWRIPNPDFKDAGTFRIVENAEGRRTLFLR